MTQRYREARIAHLDYIFIVVIKIDTAYRQLVTYSLHITLLI